MNKTRGHYYGHYNILNIQIHKKSEIIFVEFQKYTQLLPNPYSSSVFSLS